MKKIKNLPESERPREKLQSKGAEALSDIELIAILLGRGTKNIDVLTLSEKILQAVDDNKGIADLEKLKQIKGMGLAKATIISAALEFSRRRIKPEGFRISQPCDVVPLIQHYADRKQECLLCISLNGAKEILHTRVVTIGLVNQTQIHPREVFADPITDRASCIIIAHNHPSGSVNPSSEDIAITKRLKAAGETLGIHLLDHIIFNKSKYFSFKEEGLS